MIISVRNVSYSYGANQALSNISFDIKEKEFVAIIGRNGSGKTTMMKLLLGILKPQDGTIRIFGEKTSEFISWDLVGYVPQNYNIDINFPASVEELLCLKNPGRKDTVAAMLNITDILCKRFSELSGGQQQRVMIALSLMSSPKLIILDEPTVGVDINAQQDFYALLKRLNRELGVTIILVTHDVGLISSYVKNVICLNGSICCCGKAHEAEKLLKQVYGNDFYIHHH